MVEIREVTETVTDPEALQFSREEFQGLHGDIGKIIKAVKEHGWEMLALGELEAVYQEITNKRFQGKKYRQVVID